MQEKNNSSPAYLRGNFTKDLMASVVVFLVALPLCMGIAIASGVPPAYGIITGIIGGIVVGTLAGSPLQVSGPAAGLTVLIWQFVQAHGVAMLVRVVSGGMFPGWELLLAPVIEALLWPVVTVLLLAPQRRAPDPDQNRPL